MINGPPKMKIEQDICTNFATRDVAGLLNVTVIG
jgi:hypothetical protein